MKVGYVSVVHLVVSFGGNRPDHRGNSLGSMSRVTRVCEITDIWDIPGYMRAVSITSQRRSAQAAPALSEQFCCVSSCIFCNASVICCSFMVTSSRTSKWQVLPNLVSGKTIKKSTTSIHSLDAHVTITSSPVLLLPVSEGFRPSACRSRASA